MDWIQFLVQIDLDLRFEWFDLSTWPWPRATLTSSDFDLERPWPRPRATWPRATWPRATWPRATLTSSDLDLERPWPRATLTSTSRDLDLERPWPRPRATLTSTLSDLDLDLERPWPRATLTSSDLDLDLEWPWPWPWPQVTLKWPTNLDHTELVHRLLLGTCSSLECWAICDLQGKYTMDSWSKNSPKQAVGSLPFSVVTDTLGKTGSSISCVWFSCSDLSWFV